MEQRFDSIGFEIDVLTPKTVTFPQHAKILGVMWKGGRWLEVHYVHSFLNLNYHHNIQVVIVPAQSTSAIPDFNWEQLQAFSVEYGDMYYVLIGPTNPDSVTENRPEGCIEA